MARRSPTRALARALCPEYGSLPRDERDAVLALARHLESRFEQDNFAAFDADGETILTDGYMRGRLREVGARKTGEKAAAQAIRWLCASGLLKDTGKTKKPRRDPNRSAAREKFAPATTLETGGRDSQPSLQHSYWWRVFQVIPLARVLRAWLGAYAHFCDLPQDTASLSAWAVRQGLIRKRRHPSEFSPGSVQEAFAVLGPP